MASPQQQRRLQLHDLLLTFCDNVYFQPPANIYMEYPCIVYSRDFAETKFADNQPYDKVQRYLVTVIDRDPDSDIPDKVAGMPMNTFNRFFTTDDLNHDVYQVFF
jgi:hypothetical protein